MTYFTCLYNNRKTVTVYICGETLLIIYCHLAADVTESGDGVALPLALSLTVGVAGLTLIGGWRSGWGGGGGYAY